MPRTQNDKCRLCAKLSTEEAQNLHGEKGDGCWNEKRCPDRRYSYRHNAERNQRRRQRHQQQKQGVAAVAPAVTAPPAMLSNNPEELSLPVPPAPYAVIHWYRYQDNDRIHALGGELWANNQRISVFGPVHLLGNTPTQVKTLVAQMLQGFSDTAGQKFGVKLAGFAFKRELSASQCPAFDCPLRSQPVDARLLLRDSLPTVAMGDADESE